MDTIGGTGAQRRRSPAQFSRRWQLSKTGNTRRDREEYQEIERIEGNEGLLGRFCQVQYVIWQAQRAGDKDPQEALRLRTEARVLLSELMSRRGTGR